MLSQVRYLTVSILRLNSRDYVCDRSATFNPDHALNVSSIRIGPPNDTYGSKSGPAGDSVTAHRSTISTFTRNKFNEDVELAFEVPKPVTIIPPTCDAQMDTYSICRVRVSPPFKARIVGAEHIGF